MKIFVLAPAAPRPNQTAGDLRFFALLKILAEQHEVDFYGGQGPGDAAAEAALQRAGVRLVRGDLQHVLRQVRYDTVLFEFYFMAVDRIDLVRTWQPDARIVIDSVDVHLHRLRTKAKLTGRPEDAVEADTVRRAELGAYGRADVVLVVSTDDQRILEKEGLRTPVAVVPLIHEMLPITPRARGDALELVFVGSYKWQPNIDAMLYFCAEVMPLLRQRVPRLRLRIVGSAPTDEIKALAAGDVDVVGFVESTADVLLSSTVSIAPLRFGGGVKGKIAEAIAHGLPVVTTSVGAEGFGFTSGHDVMVADDPGAFCDAIVGLWTDEALYERVRRNGWARVDDFCSEGAVRRLVPGVLEAVRAAPVKRMPALKRTRRLLPHYYQKYLGWRFAR